MRITVFRKPTNPYEMDQKILRILQNCKTIKQLKQTHLKILIHQLQESKFAIPKLISLSAELHSLDYAVKIFHTSRNHGIVSCNSMIKCFIGKNYRYALRIYNQMKTIMIKPNSFTFSFILKCFQSFDELNYGKTIHGEILRLGLFSNVFMHNILLDFYAKCGENSGLALRVFEEMPERDTISWNLMIGAYMRHGEMDSAIELFDRIPERNIVTWNSVVSGLSKVGNMKLARSVFERMPERNEVSWNSLISGYIRIGDMEAAKFVFDRMPNKTTVSWTALISGYTSIGDLESAKSFFNFMPSKNVVSWNAMISGYVNNHMFDRALNVFHQMLTNSKCKPDQMTLVSVLSACSHLGSLEHGKWVESYIKKNKLELTNPLGNALVDMFAKCGDIDSAQSVFQNMTNRCIVTWTTLITGLAVNGQCRKALDLFDTMRSEGVKPDDVIFIAILSACTHGGLVKEGKHVFEQMLKEYEIVPRIEHYGCMVDLFSRAGKLEEAVRFIDSMHLEPNAVIWASLLGSCKMHGNHEMLELVKRKVLEQEPSNPGYLMLISNLSGSFGQWEKFSSFRMAMKQQGVGKVPGCSSIQLGDKVHEFLAKDTRHVQRREIYGALSGLNDHLKLVPNLL